MLTVMLLLALSALVLTIVHAMGKAPIWAAVLILCVIELVRDVPLR
jgi:hypothetical protein